MTNLTYIEQPAFRLDADAQVVQREPLSRRLALMTWFGASVLMWLSVVGLASAVLRVL